MGSQHTHTASGDLSPQPIIFRERHMGHVKNTSLSSRSWPLLGLVRRGGGGVGKQTSACGVLHVKEVYVVCSAGVHSSRWGAPRTSPQLHPQPPVSLIVPCATPHKCMAGCDEWGMPLGAFIFFDCDARGFLS